MSAVSTLHLATLVALLLVFPGLAVAQARALRGVVIERIPAYASSAATLVVLGAWCTAVGLWGRTPAALGFVAMPPGALLAWTLGVTLAGLVLMLVFHGVSVALRLEESPTLVALLPRTSGERLAFVGLSLVAGIGEEIVYRGYALYALGGIMAPVAAAVVSSVAFGVLHAYQGVLGVIRTAALGGLLAWGYLASGSLWPAVAAHAVLDILGGIVLAEKLISSAPRPPESTSSAPGDTTDPAGVP